VNVIAVIPAYNEAGRIGDVVRDTLKFVDTVVVVNDGSSDDTAAVASTAGAIVVSHVLNAGSGAATMTGIAHARNLKATVIITLDADGQHDSADIPALLKGINDGYDVAFANRFGQRNTIPFKRRLYNAIGNIVTFTATGLWVPAFIQNTLWLKGRTFFRAYKLHLKFFYEHFFDEILIILTVFTYGLYDRICS